MITLPVQPWLDRVGPLLTSTARENKLVELAEPVGPVGQIRHLQYLCFPIV